MMPTNVRWLAWANQLQAHAQNGLLFSKDPFDRERYQSIQQIAAAILASYSQQDSQIIEKLLADELGYATPKLDVRGVVFQDQQILLVKEKSDGCWTLPGGWADINESASEAVVREIYEESGYQTKAVKLLALFDKYKHDHPPQFPHAYKCFFRCEILAKQPLRSLETSEIGFFSPDNLPALSTDRVTALQIQRMFRHLHAPSLATEFD